MLPSSSNINDKVNSENNSKETPQEVDLDHPSEFNCSKKYSLEQPPSFKEASEFCRKFLFSSSGLSTPSTNSKLMTYRGFPSIHHAEAFFLLVNDRLGCNDCHTFLDLYERLETPSVTSVELMKKIKKKTLDQLKNLIVAKKSTISILDLGVENIKRIPFVVVHGRYTPSEASYLLLSWADYLSSVLEKLKKSMTTTEQVLLTRIELVNKLRKALSWRVYHHQAQDLHRYMKDHKITEFSSSSMSNKVSYMSDKFKPIIALPKIDLEKINKILKDAELPTVEFPQNFGEYNSLLSNLEELAGVKSSSISFRLRKRKESSKPTKTAFYSPTLDHQTRKTNLHQSLWHFRKYNKLLDICGRIRGRLSNIGHPYITGVASRVDKSGMATFIFKNEHYMFDENSYDSVMNDIDVPSIVFTCMAVSIFSVRKAFTMQSQMQGKLDEFLLYVLDICKMRNEKTRWDLISSVYPMEDIVSNLPNEGKMELLSKFLDLQIPMALFLQKQYDIGVKYCVDKGMSVPRSGTTLIDSSGYNAVVGAWNNSIRFIRMISKTLDQPPPLLLKCMKLTAADQMKLFSMYGEGQHSDVALFVELVKKGVTPWGIVIGSCQTTQEEIMALCKKFNINPTAWLGYTTYRSSNDLVFNEMICGCVVPDSGFAQSLLKKLNAYGYKAHKQLKKKK